MSEILALKCLRAALAFAATLGFALCTDRLFGIHGVESALALGTLIPPWAAVIGARVVDHARKRGEDVTATELIWRALLGGWIVVGVPVLLLAANSLRVRNCDPLQGATFIVLGPLAGTTLASVWGATIGASFKNAKLATLVALLGPLSTVMAALYFFYATPAIFAYGHFFGFFPGSLYDEALQIPTPLLTLRAATVAYAVALGCALTGHYDAQTHRIRLRPQRSMLFGVVAMLGFGVVLAAESDASALGHRTSVDWIAQQLGRSIEGARCRVVVPRELNHEEAQRLTDDCDFRVEQMERVIGVTQRQRVTAFFFRSPDEKRSLMGAATTYIAKPWRNEVYLQLTGWPHPVLAHEIAHVVAGNLAPGPFRVAARFGGLWPEASLIEGMAVAAAWNSNDGMSPHQWARAMLDLGLAPQIGDLLGTGFLSQPKERAYTLAGSVLKFIAETRGAGTVRQIYKTGDIESTGSSVDALQKEWETFVRAVALPEQAMAVAAQRFARASIFSSVCPHQVANLRIAVQSDLASNDSGAAIASCKALLDVDPADAWARTTLVGTLARAGQLDDASSELRLLIGPPSAPQPNIWAAEHALADAAWRRGDFAAAKASYQQLLRGPQNEDTTRMLEVKLLALDGPQAERDLLFELLVGQNMPPDSATAVFLSHELATLRTDGLGAYLEARQLFFSQRFALAARLMDNARTLGLPTKLLTTAALRLEAVSRFALGETQRSSQLWSRVAAAAPMNDAEAQDWQQRIHWTERADARKRARPQVRH